MTKTRQWALFALVAVIVVFAVGWLLLISPQRAKAKDLESQAAAAQSETATLHTELQQLLAEKKNLPAQQKILADVATKIPADPAEPTLIRQLQQAADTSGVDMSSMAPATPVALSVTPAVAPSTSSSAPAAAAPPAGAVAAPTLYQIPLVITISGSYFNCELFEHALEQLPRALLVSGMTMTGPGSDSSSTGGTTTTTTTVAPANPEEQVTATINASVFLSPADAAAIPTAPVATAPSSGTTTTTPGATPAPSTSTSPASSAAPASTAPASNASANSPNE